MKEETKNTSQTRRPVELLLDAEVADTLMKISKESGRDLGEVIEEIFEEHIQKEQGA